MAVIDGINNLIKEAKEQNVITTKAVNDTHHSFGDLYFQRMILFAALCKSYPEHSWITRKHFDEENDPMFNGDFMAGINTPAGVVSFHLKLEFLKYFDGITEIEYGPKWDGQNPEETTLRVLSLIEEKDSTMPPIKQKKMKQ